MSEIRVNKVIDEAGTGAVELTQGATLPSGKTISGAGGLNISGSYNNITGVAATFSGNVSIGGTLTYEDVTNIDSVGLITARSGINVTGGNTVIKGAVETVNVGAFSGGTLTLDTATGTVFSHDLQSGAVTTVAISNFPVTANTFHTVTLLLNQNSTGTANTLPATGIGTNITLIPYNGVSIANTSAKVSSGTTTTLSDGNDSSTAGDVDIVTFAVKSGTAGTTAFITRNGNLRFG